MISVAFLSAAATMLSDLVDGSIRLSAAEFKGLAAADNDDWGTMKMKKRKKTRKRNVGAMILCLDGDIKRDDEAKVK